MTLRDVALKAIMVDRGGHMRPETVTDGSGRNIRLPCCRVPARRPTTHNFEYKLRVMLQNGQNVP